jgi:hypothetical protein
VSGPHRTELVSRSDEYCERRYGHFDPFPPPRLNGRCPFS